MPSPDKFFSLKVDSGRNVICGRFYFGARESAGNLKPERQREVSHAAV
jgi:hypothetical protein